MPLGLGLELSNPMRREALRGVYPGPMMTQFVAATGLKGSLYLAAHDGRAHHKEFVFEPEPPQGQFCLRTEFPPAGAGPGLKRWRLPWEAVVGVFEGDWYDAASLYREWALKSAPWNGKRRLTRGGGIPAKLQDVDLWVCESGSASEVVPKAKRLQDFFGVNTAVHWYNWHQIPFDDQYPEYFPTKEGFAQGVAELKEAGILTMPYINGRLWDPATTSWRDENAGSAAIESEEGTRHEEVYGSSVPLVPMCPGTKLWQDKIAGLVQRLIAECGVSGVYIDQIGIAKAYACYASEHGHAKGGGDFWRRGYQNLLRKCRRHLGPDNFLTTEEACEPWNDLLDAFLMVNTTQRGYPILPLYSAVYGGRTLQFGFQYLGREDAEKGLPWRAKMARNFLWGGQLGWVPAWVLDRDLRKEAAFLRDLLHCRRQVRPFFIHGRMLRPPAVRGAPLLKIVGSEMGDLPALRIATAMASAWKRGTSLMVALVNLRDRPITARLSLGRMEYALKPATSLEVTRITSEGPEPAGTTRTDPIMIEERMPGRRARVLLFRPR